MKKSKLLEKLIAKAKELSAEDGKQSINSDYVVLATLTLFDGNGSFEGADPAEKERLWAVVSRYTGEIKTARQAMREMLKKTASAFSLASLLYNKLELTAESKAKAENKEEITADLFLQLIFSEPTDLISKCVISHGGSGLKKSEELDTASSRSAVNDFLTGFKTEDKQAETLETPEEAKPSEIPVEEKPEVDIPSVVKKVKSAQNHLLNTVYGQDHAVNSFISGYFQAEIVSMTQEGRTRPKATFLFAGPPGVGKTFLAEQSAEVLGLPFKRFDMSEYADKEANLEFCGSDKVYKNAKAGNVTSFVAENPKCVILFDEIEKAHLNVIHLFLQILDAGRVRDNFTDEEVSFVDSILIFTTNAGRRLYEDPDIANLSSIPRKQILNSLALDINPVTNTPLFPTAICSRFAAGNVIMFNRLSAHNLLQIVEKEFNKYARALQEKTGINVSVDRSVLYALLFAEGGNVDARTIRGRTANFFCQEIFELFRLMTSSERNFDLGKLQNVVFDVLLPEDKNARALFEELSDPKVLIFTADGLLSECQERVNGFKAFFTSNIEEAKEILFENNISLILCDVKCGLKDTRGKVLNLEDADSLGYEFFSYVTEKVHVPLYLLEKNEHEISQEEVLSFIREGARGVVYIHGDESYNFAETVKDNCNISNQQNKLLELARANKVLSFRTAQKSSVSGRKATITLFDFNLSLAPDVDDNKSILSGVSKPAARFADVIGAEDAKGELAYFVDYLKDPVAYMRRGVRSPKGILLYGPPGTGKTLLAKAMAGESDVTFIASEGNDFLKKFVGEGAKKVHELFSMARKYAPAILFIDEIDAIGKDRNSGSAGEASTGDVLTAFLTEMDGFKTQSDKPVFVLAATNYEVEQGKGKSLDPALLRRFDRKILVDLPNKPERERYIRLKVSKNKNVSLSDEQIDNIAIRSTNMSLADLESIFELALRNAIKSKDYVVDDACFENAFESYNSGEVKKWDITQLERTARHEAGHTLLCWLSGETPSYLTIVARGSHGGYMQHANTENKGVYTKEELLARIRVALAGRAAEVVYYGDKDGISTGASGDLQTATSIAEQMVCSYGMDEKIGLGTVEYSAHSSPYFSQIRDRVNEILKEEFEKAKAAISENRKAMDKLVDVLLVKNQLKGKEIDEILSGLAKR